MLWRTTTTVLLLGTIGTLVPHEASAYVREVTSTGVPLAWKNPCVTVQLFLGDPPSVLTAEQLFQAATIGGNVWSQPTLACSDIRLSVVAQADATADVGNDKKNIIVFRKQAWCATSTASAGSVSCYPHSALAVTTLFKNKNTGEILDADIAFNAVDYTWADRVESPDQLASNTADFQNALTHELGHVIGLDHSCYAPADGQPRLLDNTGSPELDCYSNPALPTSIAESTMYPSVSLRDTTRRDLSTDDQQGVCEIYPYAHETCPISEDYAPEDHKFGGCTTLPGGPRDDHTSTSTGTIALATVAAALLSLLNRRSRKRI